MYGSEWYDGPSLVTTAQITELSAKYRADSLIVSYALWLENRAYDDGMETLGAREQLVVAGAVFEREVNSGGFQAFLEYYQAYLDAAKLSMSAMGKADLAKLISDADRAYQADPNSTKSLDAFDDAYHENELDLAEDLIRLATG